MKSAAKARQLKMKHDTLVRNYQKYGGVKVGKTIIFPDAPTEKVEDSVDFVYPEVEESERVLKYQQSMKVRAERYKAEAAIKVAEGQFVDRAVLEEQWKKQAVTVRNKVLNLPGLLKMRVGEELTANSEQVLEDLCHEVLENLASGK